ncbi:hypothetical protein [Brevundimonas faecalis]|uniref:Type II secretion system protein n=1 Tax=Brevundimonas faecalis TaxID=947378 RepID=A0ABV2RC20_9CAUL
MRRRLKPKLRLSVTEVALIALYVAVLLGALAVTRGIERSNPQVRSAAQSVAEIANPAPDDVRVSREARA